MNTTKKGDEFEAKALEIIYKAIEDGKLIISIPNSKFCSKKKYYSKDRNDHITFDHAIEIWAQGAEKFQLLYIIECKSYSSNKIPVDDIEEFYTKINQVAGVNVKGILVTDAELQKSTYNFAKSKGIMVIQTILDNDYKIILQKTQRNQINIYNTSSIDNNIDSSLETFFSELFLPEEEKITGFSYHSRESLEKLAEDTLSKYDQKILNYYELINIEKFIKYIEEEYSLKTFTDKMTNTKMGEKILGFFDNENISITINEEIFNTNRFSFVFFHEFGHFILHRNLKINQKLYNQFKDSEFNITLGKYELTNVKQWIEWQANYFAASILMPKNDIKIRLINYQVQIGIRRNIGKLYIDDQPVNKKDSKSLLHYLANEYGVSKTTILYRLKTLGLIIDERKKSRNEQKNFIMTK